MMSIDILWLVSYPVSIPPFEPEIASLVIFEIFDIIAVLLQNKTENQFQLRFDRLFASNFYFNGGPVWRIGETWYTSPNVLE